MAEKEDTRCRIIEAAKKRFSHFGYAKTTMAEMATDCAMSPGNLYRFFPGKLDIAEAIATEDFHAQLTQISRLAEAPVKSARQRLHDLFFRKLHEVHDKLERDPRAYEIALIIARERPEFPIRVLAEEREVIVKVIEDGQKSGEFVPGNPHFMAEMIQSALMKFRNPQLWPGNALPELERELEGVLTLLIDGLSPRAGHAA